MDHTQILHTLQNSIPTGRKPCKAFKILVTSRSNSTFKTPMSENKTYGGGDIRIIKAHVKDIVAHKKSEPLYPKCQRKMVWRTVKRGVNAENEFLGCKAFPKCRRTVGASLLQ